MFNGLVIGYGILSLLLLILQDLLERQSWQKMMDQPSLCQPGFGAGSGDRFGFLVVTAPPWASMDKLVELVYAANMVLNDNDVNEEND